MFEIRVPATSANIGPGFDCLGIALNLYNYFYIEEIEDGLIIQGCETEFANENNLVYRSMKKCFEKIGFYPKGVKIDIRSEIPVSRGLGSSAACIIGGIIGANALAGDVLSRDEIFELATEIEGHPDNVAAALFGGLTVSVTEDHRAYYSKVPIGRGLSFCALIPDFKLSTEKSRAVLPKDIPYKDGVFNVGRVALMLAALMNGEFDLLRIGSRDRLHQPYRGSLIDNYDSIFKKCEELNSKAVFLSGAGPTIMVMLEDTEGFYTHLTEYLSGLAGNWKAQLLEIDNHGVIVNKL